MSWSTRMLYPATSRRFAYWAIHLGVSAFALWGAWAWIAAVSASDDAGATTSRVANDNSATAPLDRDNLAQLCAAIDDVGPVEQTAAKLEGSARRSYSTVWLQEGEPEKAGLKIRGMSPVGPAPKDVGTSIIEAARPEATTAALAPPRVIHQSAAPVVRRTPSRAPRIVGAKTTWSAAAGNPSDEPDVKITWPGDEADSVATAKSKSAPVDDEPLPQVAAVAPKSDKRAIESAAPVVKKAAVDDAPSKPIVLKLPGEDIAAARAAARAPKQTLSPEPLETSKVQVVAKPLETTQRIAMRAGVKTTPPPKVAAQDKPAVSPGTWNPESAPEVDPPVAKKAVDTEIVVTSPPVKEQVAPTPVETLAVAAKPIKTPAPVASAPVARAPVVTAPVVTAPVLAAAPVLAEPPRSAPVRSEPPHSAPVRSEPARSGPTAVLASQQNPPQAMPPVAAAPQHAPQSQGVPAVQARPVAQAAVAPPPATLPYVSSEESRHLAVISKRAYEHVDYGFDLAERGALYSAELEFSQALQLVAQALDAYHHNQAHSKAVAAGLTALREADDFVPRAGQPPIKLAEVISTHKTPVWNNGETEDVPPLIAMQRYYAFAQKQFMISAGTDPSAAMALYGMGRLQTALASEYGVKKMTAGPKAMALYQASIGVDPQNYLASNELGVMLARYGQLREAEVALRHSVRVAPRPENWKNLAEVYDRMGDGQNAQNAHTQHQVALRSGTRPGRQTTADRPPLKLVDNETFQKESGPSGGDEILTASKTDAKPAANGKATEAKESKGLGWIGDKVSEGMTRVVNPSKAKPTQVR